MDCIVGFEAHDLHQHFNSSFGRKKIATDHEQEVVDAKSFAVSPNLRFWKRQTWVSQRNQGHGKNRVVGQKRKLITKSEGGKTVGKKARNETILHQETVSGTHGLAEAAV
jgi:hypothetical protein